jgi:hypothetical protein
MAIKRIPIKNQAQRDMLLQRVAAGTPQENIDNISVGEQAEFNSEMYTIAGVRSVQADGAYDRLLLDLLAPDLSHVYTGVPADQVTVPTQTTANMREGDEGFPGVETGSHDPLFEGVMDLLLGEGQDEYTRRALGMMPADDTSTEEDAE